MFLDLKSSTSYAEQLGHIKYSRLIQDCFYDLTDVVRIHQAQIYQYVGDEVVVSWALEEGISEANCLHCFFDILDTIDELSFKYLEKYEMVPTFKAGMHFGKVSTGTIGTIKKEIIYTGDVLNTTSRIEGQCNPHNVNLLLSKDLMNKLPNEDQFKFVEIGEISLRGKASFVTLFTGQRN